MEVVKVGRYLCTPGLGGPRTLPPASPVQDLAGPTCNGGFTKIPFGIGMTMNDVIYIYI